MGRHAKPIDLLVAQGKKHLTKSEIEERKKNEIKLGNNKLKCPNFIKNNVNAYAKWKEIIKIYKDIGFVSSGDSGLLARYCMTFNEYNDLLERRKRINSISQNADDVTDYIENDELFDFKVKSQLEDMISTSAILQIDTAINKKMDMLIKMEDRLFLNPLSKVKNIPKNETKKEDKSEEEKEFGDV